MKLKGNSRFVNLRQLLADQKASPEKQAANQKAELDALSPPFSPILLAPLSSAKSILSSKGDEGAQRNLVPAPLFDRASIRSIRLKGSGDSGQLPDLDETVATSLSGLRRMDG